MVQAALPNRTSSTLLRTPLTPGSEVWTWPRKACCAATFAGEGLGGPQEASMATARPAASDRDARARHLRPPRVRPALLRRNDKVTGITGTNGDRTRVHRGECTQGSPPVPGTPGVYAV